jgi:hypothetical protein
MSGYKMPNCEQVPDLDAGVVDLNSPTVLANQALSFDAGPFVTGAAMFKHESQHGMYTVVVKSSTQADFDSTLEIYEYFVSVVVPVTVGGWVGGVVQAGDPVLRLRAGLWVDLVQFVRACVNLVYHFITPYPSGS